MPQTSSVVVSKTFLVAIHLVFTSCTLLVQFPNSKSRHVPSLNSPQASDNKVSNNQMVLGYTFLTRGHLHISLHATVLSPHKQIVYCTPRSSRFTRHQLTSSFLNILLHTINSIASPNSKI